MHLARVEGLLTGGGVHTDVYRRARLQGVLDRATSVMRATHLARFDGGALERGEYSNLLRFFHSDHIQCGRELRQKIYELRRLREVMNA